MTRFRKGHLFPPIYPFIFFVVFFLFLIVHLQILVFSNFTAFADVGHFLHFYFNPAAKATHCGYRTFESWCRMACQYGQCDVILARDKGYSGMLSAIFGWYHKRNMLTRWLTRACLRRSYLIKAAVRAIRAVAAIADFARLEVISRYAYSGAYNLLYWRGVADELGSVEAFWNHVKYFKPAAGLKGQEKKEPGEVRSRS